MRDDLLAALRGLDVAADAETRGLYSRDRSPFVVEPLAVVRARSVHDVAAAVSAAGSVGVPVTARAGGSSVAGQCLGSGLVVDTSALGGVALDGDAVWVGAGVGLDDLNQALARDGRMIGPDVTSSEWARVGGLVGTNACGSRSLRFGRFGDALLAAEVVLSDGSVSTLSRSSPLWPSLAAVLEGLEEEVGSGWPRQHRGFGGYALDAFAARGDPLALVPGSEGTLCLVTRARLSVVPRPRGRVISRAEFPTLRAALEAAPALAESGAAAVEVLDTHLTGGLPVLLVEHLDAEPRLPSPFEVLAPEDGEAAWSMRGEALGRLEAADTSAVALFEDPAVAPERAGAFADDLLALLDRFGFGAVVYGHAAAGCLHVRPLVSRGEPRLAERLLEALKEVAELVASYDGAITGEHGWGLARSHLAEHAMGEALYARCLAVKKAWDPANLLNPGRIVNAHRPDPAALNL